jgi:hypothetical protein
MRHLAEQPFAGESGRDERGAHGTGPQRLPAERRRDQTSADICTSNSSHHC